MRRDSFFAGMMIRSENARDVARGFAAIGYWFGTRGETPQVDASA